MIPRFGESINAAERYRLRPGAYVILRRGDLILLTHQAAPVPELQLPGGGIDPGEQPVAALRVWKGTQKTVKAGFGRAFVVAVPRGYGEKLRSEFAPLSPRQMAPIEMGQTLGTLKVTIDGKPYGEYPVPSLENVGLVGIFGRTIDSVLLWFQ